MVGLVGAVLAVSLWTVQRAGGEALLALRNVQSRLAQDTSSELHDYLGSFDRDTRLMAELAAGTRRQAIDRRAQDQAILAAFKALATVVPHYRTIALFGGGGPIVAVDPTEDPVVIAPVLVEASAAPARAAIAERRPTRAGPLALRGGRSFYLYAVPVGDGEAVVVTSDAAMMLEAVSRRPSGASGLVVIDPSGAAWVGCEQRQRCRLLAPGTDDNAELMETIDAGSRQARASSHPGLAHLGFPSRVTVGIAAPLVSPLGSWSVALIAPADADVRQQAFLRQLVITSIGVATAMLAVGLLILRQHSNAAALGVRLRAAEEVAALQRQLVRAEKLVTVGVLSAGIAHEIGTPLSVVRGRAEHMLERVRERRDAEDLRAVVGEIDHISSTIRQVLAFSRDQPVDVAVVDARAAVERALELLEWHLGARQVEVDVVGPPDLPPLAAASDQFEQVVVNLLMNACDASPPGSRVEVRLRQDPLRDDRLRVAIRDRGVGIPPEHLNAVFDPYFTTKKRGEGTGLGLAMVWQIVRSHRGEISLKSKPGAGTTATVSWPIADRPTPARRAELG
jgi:signal transduction histidine kinase